MSKQSKAARIRELVEEGLPPKKIARQMGREKIEVSLDYIYQVKHRMEDPREELKQLYRIFLKHSSYLQEYLSSKERQFLKKLDEKLQVGVWDEF